jgi:hypothetical protein
VEPDVDSAVPTDELVIDWELHAGLALEWERQERKFREDWDRRFVGGPGWDAIADYHRHGYAARKLHPEEPRDAVLARIRRAFDRGAWETNDPWTLIETVLREGWREAETVV